MRASTSYLLFTSASIFASILLLAHAGVSAARESGVVKASAPLVRELGLTDLCLFTEARYTRHPAVADRHSAFQDHPVALDHFPTGSLLTPPAQLTRDHAQTP